MIIGARWLKAEAVSDQQFRVVLLLIRDDEQTFEMGFRASGATAVQVRDDLTRQIIALNAVDTTKGVLAAFPSNFPIPTEFEVAVDPNPALTKWLNDLRKWERVKTALVDTGVLAADNADVLVVRDAVVAGLKAGYIDAL